VLLAAAAARTSRTRLGPCIAILPLRHPLSTATAEHGHGVALGRRGSVALLEIRSRLSTGLYCLIRHRHRGHEQWQRRRGLLLAGERPIRAFLGGNTEFCLHWLGEERLESQHHGQAPHQKTGRFEGQANRRRKTRDSVVALEGCESTEKAVYFIQEPSIVAWHRIAI
jgi:hypothetical protein